MTVYVLRDLLKQMWRYSSRRHAERHWKQWYAHAVRSRIDPLRRFAKKLKPYRRSSICPPVRMVGNRDL